MIDRLRLLEVVASIFVSITIMDLSLNMNDNLELCIKKIEHSRSETFRVMALQCGLCLNLTFCFPLCTEDNKSRLYRPERYRAHTYIYTHTYENQYLTPKFYYT